MRVTGVPEYAYAEGLGVSVTEQVGVALLTVTAVVAYVVHDG